MKLAATPFLAAEDLLVNGIMRRAPVICSGNRPPNVRDTDVMIAAAPDGSVNAIEATPANAIGIEIPGALPQMRALGEPPQLILHRDLQRQFHLDPADYRLIGVQDKTDANALITGHAREYWLLMTQDAHRKLAMEAMKTLADPCLGTLLTHHDRLDHLRTAFRGIPADATLIRQMLGDGPVDEYRREISIPDSRTSKLITDIMRNTPLRPDDADFVQTVTPVVNRNGMYELLARAQQAAGEGRHGQSILTRRGDGGLPPH